MRFSAFFLLLVSLHVAPACAATTQWQDLGGGRARMAVQLDPADGSVTGVVEIELNEGWKTYWREPGGTGIPPQFDFSSSKHFLPGETSFPAPHVLSAAGSRFAGYKGTVRFVFKGETTGAQDGRIGLDFLAGVCDEICIPAMAHFEIPFSRLNVSDAEAARAIAEALPLLPSAPRPGLRTVAARLSPEGHLRVQTETAPGEDAPQLFVEGPDGWYFEPAKLISREGSIANFEADALEMPAGVGETRLRMTLAQGQDSVEEWVAPSR